MSAPPSARNCSARAANVNGDGSVNVHGDMAAGGSVSVAVNNAANAASDYFTRGGVVTP